METVDYKGYTIQIEQESYPSNPRTNHDNLATMACRHSRYDLGDTEEIPSNLERDTIWLPLYLYDHSGITMNTTGFSCPWDSSQVGYIYVTKTRVRKEYKWRKLTAERIAKIKEYLVGEVETYDHYITGNVYGYKIVDSNGFEWDSCWGFYGYNHEESGLLEYAKNHIDYLAKELK